MNAVALTMDLLYLRLPIAPGYGLQESFIVKGSNIFIFYDGELFLNSSTINFETINERSEEREFSQPFEVLGSDEQQLFNLFLFLLRGKGLLQLMNS